MSRFDKYDPVSGGFRAPLNAAILTADVNKVQAVSLNASGKVVLGGAPLAVVGVICPVRTMAANEIIDVMQHGEIVEFTLTGGGPAVAGTPYYVDITGLTVSSAAPGVGLNLPKLGNTVELDRLVVRLTYVQG